jgi:Orthopoxvirus protein of unknown function (DUF830).
MGNHYSLTSSFDPADYKKQFHVGDLVFFGGGHNPFSKVITGIESCINGHTCIYSHVGIITRKDCVKFVFPNNDPNDTLYVWHSGFFSGPDADTHHVEFGVQIQKLDDVIAMKYQSGHKMGWGQLKNNPFLTNPEKIRTMLRKLYSDYFQTSFDSDPAELVSSCLPCMWKCSKKESLFCSQFVATIYQHLGILSTKYSPSKILPMDFIYPEGSMERIDPVLDLIEELF